MGKSLARMTEAYIAGNMESATGNIVPLRDLQTAINMRTAGHIGLSISPEQRQGFALVFPAP